MTLMYAVVCRATDAVVLTEACDKDLKSVIGPAFYELLQHLRTHPLEEGDRQTFVQKPNNIEEQSYDFLSHFLMSCQAAIGETENISDDYYFHIFRRNNVYYGCLGDDARLPYQKVHFAFLEQVANEFSKRYWSSRVQNAKAMAMDSTFLPTLRSAMHYHNINADKIKQDDKVKHMLAKTDSVQNALGRNLNMLLQNQTKYDGLLQRSEILSQDVKVFRKKARVTKRRMQVRYYFWSMACCGIILLLSYLVLASSCGITLQHCVQTGGGGGDGGNNNNQGGNDQK